MSLFGRFFSGFITLASSLAGSFLDLSDTPSTYTGQAGKGIRVNAGASGLEFYTISSGGSVDSFETVSKNLLDWDATYFYVDGVLDEITYTKISDTIIKSFYYDVNDNLTSIVLTGDLPPGIHTTKTFTYNINSELIAVTYT